ncbi:hypothetical protein [Boseongicola sp. H5]|uniref:hypothetical protein n=1 Tax=Boseongicola sp. H5 TaxID=2763261 RepID=UPI001D0B1D7B|nr:hypothetical protein [Boseongicola sp. H5]
MTSIDRDHRLIAILRGITARETGDVVAALIETGYRAIEVPMNSPDALASIEIAVDTTRQLTPDACLIGAGTVLAVEEVARVKALSANLIVSPNTDPSVIKATRDAGMQSLPGVFTPTEAHLAPKADVKSGDVLVCWKKDVNKQRLGRISGSLFMPTKISRKHGVSNSRTVCTRSSAG